MQTVHSLLRLDRLPHSPTTVRFEFTIEPKIYWLVIEGEQPELCYNDPGRDAELVVTVDGRCSGPCCSDVRPSAMRSTMATSG